MKVYSIAAAAFAFVGLVAAYPTGHKTYYKHGNKYYNSNNQVIVDVQIDINTVFFFDNQYHNRNGDVIEEVDIQIDATIVIEEDSNDRHHGHGHSKRDGREVYYKHNNKYYNSYDFNSNNEVIVDVQIDINTVFFFDGQYHDYRGNVIEEVDIQIDVTIIVEDNSYDNSRDNSRHHGHGHSKRDGRQVYYKHNNKYYNSDDFNSDDIVVDVQIDINTVFFFDGQYHDYRGNVIEEVDIQIDVTIIVEDNSYDNSRDNSRHNGHGHSKRDGHQVYYKHNNKYYSSDDFNSDDIVVDVQIDINTVFFFDGQYHDHRGNVIEEVDIQIDVTIIVEDNSYNSRHHGHGHGSN